jgi:glycosyltransferase involved in cell wall biosynthesis
VQGGGGVADAALFDQRQRAFHGVWVTARCELNLITVGLPVCNAMPGLVETVTSLFEQTTESFEILAVVDGGGDGSLEYLQSLSDPRLRILTQENQGVTYTLNRLLRECRTPWLARQDADDVSHPRRIERILEAIREHPDAGMFYSLANYHPRGRAAGSFRSTRGSPEDLRNIVRSGYLLSICHPTVTLHVKKTLAISGYRVGMHNEDADLWWRMALAYDIHCIPEELVGFRQSAESVSSRNLREQAIAGLYVQYLLLSHLWRRPARPIAQVRAELESIMPRATLQAKERLRTFNIDLARGSYAAALRALAESLRACPSYVVRRFGDEVFASRLIANGVDPQLYREREEALWQ